MSINSGERLGPYEIRAVIGHGGMGEVYRALDQRIGREVAIKVLPVAFAEDSDRLARFEQEARAAGVLNHPGILAVHDVGHENGVHFLVTELLEGETLRQKLATALSQRKLIDYSLQIAKALAAAHDKGIIHRDLKPENLFATNDGRIKILDFGLAKLKQPDAIAGISQIQTVMPESTPGIILGTVGYMSPEQVRGKTVDHRSDIFSFGTVLYEMITGRRAFHADTVADTLSAILNKEPAEISSNSVTPALSRIVEHCMEKNPEQRFQSMHDVAFYLETLSGVSIPTLPQPVESKKPKASWIPWIVTLLTILGSLAWIVSQKGSRNSDVVVESQRFDIQLPADQQLAIVGNSLLTFSPDGKSLVFAGFTGGKRMLRIRRLTERQSIEINGTDDGETPFFSPDGKWLGFVSRGQLWKVPVEGGQPIRLGNARGAGGAAWVADNKIVFAPIYSDGLFQVNAEGGTAERLTTPDKNAGVLGHWWPDPLPAGDWVIFTAFRTPVDNSRIGAVNLKTHEVHWLVDGGFYGRYSKSGYLLYAKGQRMYAVPLDLKAVTVNGTPRPVLEDLLVEQTSGTAMFAVSEQGVLAYVTESLGLPQQEVVWLDRSGHSTQAIPEPHHYLTVAVSPDGQRAALTLLDESRDLWIYSFSRGTLSRLTTGDYTEFGPVWSPDGNDLYYIVDRPPFTIYHIGPGVPDSGKPLWEEKAKEDTLFPAISPDGRTLAFTLNELETGTNIYSRPLDGSGSPKPFRVTRNTEDHPSFSPDGKWLAYESDETGRPEIYVEAFPGPGERFQISTDGGREPVWAANGEIFYRRQDELHVVTTRLEGKFEFNAAQTLFTFPFPPFSAGGITVHVYDVSPDGKRILAITTPATLRARQIDIVTNWTNELQRLLPSL